MGQKEVIAYLELVDRRTYILAHPEEWKQENEEELERIGRSLAQLRDEEEQSWRHQERVKIMKEAIALGLWTDLQHFITEAKREKRKPYIMSKGIMADLLYRYIRTIWPEAETVEYDEEQWIVVTECQKRELERKLKERMENHIKKGIRLQRAWEQSHEIVEALNDQKRNGKGVIGIRGGIQGAGEPEFSS